MDREKRIAEIESRFEEISKRKAELSQSLESRSTDEITDEEITSIKEEVDSLDKEKAELEEERSQLKKVDNVAEQIARGEINAKKVEKKEERKMEDKFNSLEYREAFRKFVTEGVAIPEEYRDSATTKTTDITGVIPTTIMNRIIEKVETLGEIFARVTKTNYKGGLAVPVAGAQITATWKAEGTVADKQKKTTGASITFSYYKLQVRVASSLEAGTVSLEIWENNLVDSVSKAMIKALETAILVGDGSGQPTGVIAYADENNSVSVGTIDFQTSRQAEALIPSAYENNDIIIMNKKTWEKQFVGMVDDNGQPIARVNYGINGKISRYLDGREVLCNDNIKSFDAASNGDVIAVYADLSEYCLNSNLQMTVREYFDEDTDEFIKKATMLADGKMLDANGLVFIKKSASL